MYERPLQIGSLDEGVVRLINKSTRQEMPTLLIKEMKSMPH